MNIKDMVLSQDFLGILKRYPDGRTLIGESIDAYYNYVLYNRDNQVVWRRKVCMLCPKIKAYYVLNIYNNKELFKIILLRENELIDCLQNVEDELIKSNEFISYEINEITETEYFSYKNKTTTPQS